jgi:hypothetical protein
MRPALWIALLTLTSGCAVGRASPQQDARGMESQLSAAGFRRVTADTPERTARLNSLSPYKLDQLQRNGRTYWYYVDPTCHCAWVGDAAAYGRYQNSTAASDRAKYGTPTALNESGTSVDATEDFFSPENPELYGAPGNW